MTNIEKKISSGFMQYFNSAIQYTVNWHIIILFQGSREQLYLMHNYSPQQFLTIQYSSPEEDSPYPTTNIWWSSLVEEQSGS